MLVLSRKTGERAIIAGNVRVVVLSVHRGRVKLGFDGPDDVPIHREEVLQQIAQESPEPTSAVEGEHSDRHVRRTSTADLDSTASQPAMAVTASGG